MCPNHCFESSHHQVMRSLARQDLAWGLLADAAISVQTSRRAEQANKRVPDEEPGGKEGCLRTRPLSLQFYHGVRVPCALWSIDANDECLSLVTCCLAF